MNIKNIDSEVIKISTIKDILKNTDTVLEVNRLNVERIEKNFKGLDKGKIFYIKKEGASFGLVHQENQFNLI